MSFSTDHDQKAYPQDRLHAQSLLNALLKGDIIDKGYVCLHPGSDTDGSMDLDPRYINLH